MSGDKAGRSVGRQRAEGKTIVYRSTIAEAELAEAAQRALVVDGWPVLILRVDGQILAVINRCTHAASPLEGGRVRRGAIGCPLHGARFDLKSGACVGGAYAGLVVFPTRIVDGWIEVDAPDQPPSSDYRPVKPA